MHIYLFIAVLHIFKRKKKFFQEEIIENQAHTKLFYL